MKNSGVGGGGGGAEYSFHCSADETQYTVANITTSPSVTHPLFIHINPLAGGLSHEGCGDRTSAATHKKREYRRN